MHGAIKVFAPHSVIPGLAADSNREIVHQLRQVADELGGHRDALEIHITDLKTASGYVVALNEIARVNPPAAGMTITLPPVTEANEGDVCGIAVVSVASGGTVTVGAVNGAKINGAATMTLSAVGLYLFTSLGGTYEGWTTPPVSAGGGAAAWSAVLALGATSGANNPIVDVGQFMQFGLVGPTTSSPQIRSGDAVFRVRGTNAVSIGGGTGAVFFASAGVAEIASDTVGDVRITTASGTVRLAIAQSGEWTTPTGGSSGFVLTHNGAGAPPTWQAASGGGTDPRIFAWFGV